MSGHIASPVYVAGPMTGLEDWNRAAFADAARMLRLRDLIVVTPIEEDEIIYGSFEAAAERPWQEHLSRDLALVASDRVNTVAVLPGWRESKGASAEVYVARTLGKPVIDAFTLEPVFETYEENPLRQRQETGGVKDNRGKSRVDLIPTAPLILEGEVLEYGARKYKPNNWRLGLRWSDTMGSLLRHLFAFQDGEDIDPETKLPHLGHAMCQLSFLTEYYLTSTGIDDRWGSTDPEEALA